MCLQTVKQLGESIDPEAILIAQSLKSAQTNLTLNIS